VDGPATLSEELSEQFTRMLQEANVAALNSGAYSQERLHCWEGHN
jgi:hypothetical protein